MAGDIMLGIAGGLMAMEGVIKVAKPNYTFMRMSIPCGWGLMVLGAALLVKAIAG
jgi:hypothetical protein